MTEMSESRRKLLRSVLTAGVYSVPAIASIGIAQEVAAVSSAPSNSTVTISVMPVFNQTEYTFVGNGFLPNTGYVLILFNQNSQPADFAGVLTDALGSFTNKAVSETTSFKIGKHPAGVNGGIIFVAGVASKM